MKVLFVWPNRDQGGFKPMGIALLSAVLKREGHNVELFDTTFFDFKHASTTEARDKLRIFKPIDWSGYDVQKTDADPHKALEEHINRFQPGLVCVSALSDEVELGLQLSKTAKDATGGAVAVVWGGKAATMNPFQVLKDPHVNGICRGEGLHFLPELVRCLDNYEMHMHLPNMGYRPGINALGQDEYKLNPIAPYFRDLDGLPHFDWSVFDDRHFLKPYDGKVLRGGDHMIYWGCPNECTYCINKSWRELYNNEGAFLRHYSVDRIIDELEYLSKEYKLEFWKFHDEDFCLKSIAYFEELARKYKERVGLPFTAMANCKNITVEKAKLLKEMGCVSISVGIETGNEDLRKHVLKRRETKDDIINGIRRLKEESIRTSAFNLLAIPGETRETIMETIELNRKSGVQYPNAGFFFPLDNTELKDFSVKQGLYNAKEGRTYSNERPCLKLPTISEEELIALRDRFVLYIKLPEEYHRYIKRSEENDENGREMLKVLQLYYEETVFANDGTYKAHPLEKQYKESCEILMHG